MLAVYINNKQIWLPPDTKIRLDMAFPYFQDNVIPENVINWFDAPAVQPNIEIFEYSHFYEVNRKLRIYDCYVEFAGNTVISGKAIVKNFSNNRYRICCVNNAFKIQFGDKLLSDIVDEDVVIGTNTNTVVAHANNCATSQYPVAKWQFPPIKNDEFYGENLEYNLDYIGINVYSNGYLKNCINQDPVPDNCYSLLPMPYLLGIFEKIFAYSNYKTFGSFFDHPEIKKLIVYNNYPIDFKRPKKYYSRGILTAPQVILAAGPDHIVHFNDFATYPNEDNDGCWQNGISSYKIKAIGYHYCKSTVTINGNFQYGNETIYGRFEISGMSTMIDPLTSYPQLTEIVHEFTFFATPAMIGKTIHFFMVAAYYDFTVEKAEVIIENTSYDNLNIYDTIINLKNHVPTGVIISDWLNVNKTAFPFALFFNPDSREVQIELMKDVIESEEYVDISDYVLTDPSNTPDIEAQDKTITTYHFDFGSNDDLVQNNFKAITNYNFIGFFATPDLLPSSANVNDVAIVKNINKIYYYEIDPVYNVPVWREYTDNWLDLIIDNRSVYELMLDNTSDVVDVKPTVSTLFNFWSEVSKTYVPRISQLATSAAFSTGINAFDYKLLIYHGLRNTYPKMIQPFASSTAFDKNGNQIANLEMKWDGDLGLYENFHKEVHEFEDGCELVTLHISVDTEMFYNLTQLFLPQRNSKKRKIMYKSIKHIPKTISFMISNKGVEDCEAVLMKAGGKEI